MVAGWDHLLPAWFSRLDPRYRTPVGSVLFAGVAGAVLLILANVGTGNQEAFQLLHNAGGILFALTYLVMFAIPLVARGEKRTWGVRAAAFSGFLTLLYVVLSIFPIIDVPNPWLFSVKIVAVVAGLQCAGTMYYRWKTVAMPRPRPSTKQRHAIRSEPPGGSVAFGERHGPFACRSRAATDRVYRVHAQPPRRSPSFDLRRSAGMGLTAGLQRLMGCE
jgi:amino acid transporter